MYRTYTILFIVLILKTVFFDGSAFAFAKAEDASPFGLFTSFYPSKRDMKKLEEMRKNLAFEGEPADDPPYSTAIDLGVRWERTALPVLNWSFVQRDKASIVEGRYNWSIPDSFLKRIPKDFNILVTIIVGEGRVNTGTWQFANPKLKEAFAAFVKRAVERYDGDGIDDMPGLTNPVKFWQIENEPTFYWGRPKPNLDWRGYLDLVKVAAEAVKSADRTAKVLSAGTFDPQEQKEKQLLLEEFWIPFIRELKGRYIDIFDIHWYDNWQKSFRIYKVIRNELDRNTLSHVKIWSTETGVSSRQYGEKVQAIDLIRRFVYPLSYGVEKVFWSYALVEGGPPFNCKSIFEHTGLIYDGYCDGDPGYGVKKLAFYSYKLMTEKLKGSSWDNIETVSDGKDNIYAFKFHRGNEEVYVIWWDFERDRTKKITEFNMNVAKDGVYVITEAVPNFDSGKDIKHYRKDIFQTKKIKSSHSILPIELSSVPVYIELSKD